MALPLIALFISGVAAFDHVCQNKPEVPMTFETHQSSHCRSKEFAKDFHGGMENTMCMYPKDTIVHIDSGVPGVKYSPSAVVVKRCAGMCHNQLSCVPKEKKMTVFSVYQRKDGEPVPTCGQVHIEEHVRCKCDCTVMESHCNKKQEYDKQECMCKCMNMDEREPCEKDGKLWDQKECKCNCKQEEDCTTGHYWVPSLCRCAKMMDS